MNLISFFTNQQTPGEYSSPEAKNDCPNCWGTQAYAGAFLEPEQNERIDLNNIEQKTGWIQAYAAKHFEGIQLHNIQEMLECPSYRLTYRLI